MNSPTSPPPDPPSVPGMGRVLLAGLFPAVVSIIVLVTGITSPIAQVLIALAFLVPAWAALARHRHAWVAAGGRVFFSAAMIAVAVAVLVLVLFGVCALNG